MPTITNDLVLIKQLISQRNQELAPNLDNSEYFEVFAAEQALKDRDLSYDEIADGIVDGGGDGGIDGIYLFIYDTLCREAIDPHEYKSNVPMELIFVQAKTANGFTEMAMNKVISSAKDLLDLNKELSSLTAVYNADVIGKMETFRNSYLALISKFPKLSIRYYYAALATEVHPNVERKKEDLYRVVQTAFSPVDFTFEFLTAGTLLGLARRTHTTVHQLKSAETPISTGQSAYACLVKLDDYRNFITEGGQLNDRIFEGNVRDYQGNTEVNQKIRDTLRNDSGEDFWWLNNGISVLCTEASVSGKTLTLKNAEVVNGLQTSREIFEVSPSATDERSVLVRVIVTEDEESRDRVIRATNSQTSIPSASLRATDKIHRDIEQFLVSRGLFYDRRKNFYKNQGKPLRKIVSIAFVAQSVLACALADPANARARPSSLIKRDDDYFRIFSEEYPLDVYYKSTALALAVEDCLRSGMCTIPRSHWNNVRFYSAMLVARRLIGTQFLSATTMASVQLEHATSDFILSAVQDVWTEYDALGANDQVAKGTDLKPRIVSAESARRASV